MSEVVLQSIVDQLKIFEKNQEELKFKIEAIQEFAKNFKDITEQMSLTQNLVKNIPQQISITAGDITSLKESITKLNTILKEPVPQKIKHIHYTSKPLLGCIVLVIIIIGLCVWIGRLYDRQTEYSANHVRGMFSHLKDSLQLKKVQPPRYPKKPK